MDFKATGYKHYQNSPVNNVYSFQLKHYQSQPMNHHTYIKLIHAHLPNLVYTIDSTNIIFSYNAHTNNILTPGVYTTTSLITALDAIFTANSDAITTTYDESTNRFTFSAALTINAKPFNTLIGYSISSSSTATTSPNQVDLSRIRQFIIQTQFQGQTLQSVVGGEQDNTLTVLPAVTPSSFLETYINLTNQGCVINQDMLIKIDIRILDQDLNDVDFHGVEWQLLLDVKFIPNDVVIPQNDFSSYRKIGFEKMDYNISL